MSHSIKIVLVHGWGMNSAVWEKCTESFPDWIQIILVDLPGHGSKSGNEATDFNSMVQTVAAETTAPVIWVGWSLGGLVCLKLAELFPEKVLGLCLVATNPCFVKKDEWQSAIEQSVFDDFSAALKSDIDKTIKRFLALQVAGSKTTISTIKTLQKALLSRGRADSNALDLGLDILSGIDLRESLKHIDLPMQWILGSRDSLVPVSLVDSLQLISPGSDIVVLEAAAHAPFISHPEAFTESLIHFASAIRASNAADS